MKRKTHMVAPVAVAGAGAFPLDMLRYDNCVPRTQADVYAIGATGLRIVYLEMYTEDGHGPTQERWRSFHWLVLDMRQAAGVAQAADPIAELKRLMSPRREEG